MERRIPIHRCKCRFPRLPTPRRRCSPARHQQIAAAFAIVPPAPTPTSTTLGSSASSVYYGQTVTLTATLSRSDGGGTVAPPTAPSPSPAAGRSRPHSSAVGGRRCARRSFPAGTYGLTATYTGDPGTRRRARRRR